MKNNQLVSIAKDAFYGVNNRMMDIILKKNSYEIDGNIYPANSISLEDCIKTVKSMSKLEIEKLKAVGVI